MKNFIIFCLFLALLSSIRRNQDLLQSVAVMDQALGMTGQAYQAERQMLLNCRAQK